MTVNAKWTTLDELITKDANPAFTLAKERGYKVEYRTSGTERETDVHIRVTGAATGSARVTYLQDNDTAEARELTTPSGPGWREVARLVKDVAEAVLRDEYRVEPRWVPTGWEFNELRFHPHLSQDE